ncbi:MAG: cytochrome B [Betaproteobacteria bacterium HGW-Betaproteobacteria-13]|jgi:cytochrome b|uniref:Cytochrome B n=1 Tax=Parazoarcus communis TaxID=41977 RepID=A0A2U8HAE9_9RHOO|nr:cytochrome b/b6 domain-containing protein [Parazoarcus communis]AWI81735.1 cytochrome B [Parazoarcus communis]PKO56355.1 MAG: cytochrome B [Betaproteobacteria bacterium HGW-Betaproteobacteria-21]PKO80908.1 MAG: cytochrome B [Betaproteobacteria bacterium HGW-Betaproteobacteria-13]
MTRSESNTSIRVWDRFVRLFHWSLVLCVITNYFVIDDGETLHQWIGYLASALVLARIVWGFIGTRYARFSDFFPTPTRLRQHISHVISGQPDPHPGHNPMGALMMLTLIALVLALGLSGFMQTLDAFWGEEWLQELHEAFGSILIGLAVLHAAAAIIMSRIDGTNLIGAMISGVKTRTGKAARS